MGKHGRIGGKLPVSNKVFAETGESLHSALEGASSGVNSLQESVNSLSDQLKALQRDVSYMRREVSDGRTEVRNTYDVVIDGRHEICNTYDVVMDGRKENYITHDVAAMAMPSRYSNVEYLLFDSANPIPRDNRILIAGWYGAGNFGDEMMLRTLLGLIPEDALSRVTVLLCDCFSYVPEGIPPQVRFIHYPKSIWELDAIADLFGCVVWGGGAHIDDGQYTDDADNVNTGNLLPRLSEKMLARGKRVFCLGLSSNTMIKNKAYASLVGRMADLSSAFYVRDPYSIEVLSSAFACAGPIKQCDDIAFASPLFEHGRRQGGNGLVGFIPICDECLEECNFAIISKMSQVLLHEGASRKLRVIPFYRGGDDHDRSYLQRLLCDLDAPNVELADYPDYTDCEVVRNCSLVLSARYHGVLLAGGFGARTVALSWGDHPHYPNKMRYLMESLGLGNQLYTVEGFAALDMASMMNCLNQARFSSTASGICERARKFYASISEKIVEA